MKKIIYHIIICTMFALPVSGWGQQKGEEPEEGSKAGFTYYKKVIKQKGVPPPSNYNPMTPIPNTNYNTYIARDTIRLLPNFHTLDIAQKPFIAKIDETLIFDIDYQDPIDPDERELDYSKPVGSTAGAVDVSPTGAATYQIPIFTPPGTAGIEPKISIVYNSQGGNGLLGIGWDIAGLSAITRAPKTIYHDGESSSVTVALEDFYNNGVMSIQMTDKLALDGERMIMLPNTGDYYCHPNSVFTTENEKFLRIKPKDYEYAWGLPVLPTWFEVQDKNGMTLEYGRAGNSKITEGCPYAWKLNKVTDANGNYMNYTYKDREGVSWIDKIEYTGNSITGMSTYNTITFLYATRSDQQILHMGNAFMKSTVLLRGIKIESEGKTVRRYWFNYNKDFYSHLIEVIEEGSDGKSLNSTIVQWGNGTHELTKKTTPACYAENEGWRVVSTADFNCDGKEDIVVLNQTNKKWRVYVASESGFVKKYESSGYSSDIPEWIMVYTSPPGIANASCIFVEERRSNGNSCKPKKDEKCVKHKISRHVLDAYDNNHNELNTYILTSNNNAIWEYSFTDSKDNTIEYGDLRYPPLFQAFDCIGNGEVHFIAKSPYQGKRLTNLNLDNIEECIDLDEGFVLADFTGAGKQSLLTIKSMNDGKKIGVHLYTANSSGTFSTVSGSGNTFLGQKIMLGDFNGDGKADLFISDDKEKKHYVALSMGNGFTDAVEIEELDGRTSGLISIGDIDGDGKSDIIAEHRSYVSVAYAKGDGTFEHQDFLYPDGLDDVIKYRSLIDYYGTGKKALCYVKYTDNSIMNILSFHSENTGERQHFVKNIRNGLNESISFEYLPLTKGGELYKKEYPPADNYYYMVQIQSPLYVVSKLKQEDGIGGDLISEYSYQGARVHLFGKGFVGFSKITMKNRVLDRMIVSFYEPRTPNFIPYLSRQETSILSLNKMITTKKIDQKAKDLGNKRYFSYIEDAYDIDDLKTSFTYVHTHFIYDDAGNITEQKKEYNKNGGSTTVFTETNKYKYQQYGGWGIANRLVNDTTITKHADDTKSYTRSISYQYDPNGNMTKAISDVGVTTSYNINSFGLADKKTVSASGHAIVEDFIYDSKKRFIETTTVTGLGSSSKKYDNIGNLQYEIDITGQKTSCKYDGFGRLTGTKTPEGHIITTKYEWGTVPNTTAISYIETTAPGRPKTITYYDIFGREVYAKTEGFFENTQTKMIITEQQYNAKGQLWKTYFPYFDGDTPQWTENVYRDDGRIKTTTAKLATYLTTTYEYDDNNNNNNNHKVTVIMPDNKTKSTKTFNAHGDLIKVVENNEEDNSIVYTYYSSGQPKRITAADVPFEMTYDKFGRQDTLFDPNAGVIVYTYNAFGDILTQKDARGKVTTNVYDNFRRIQTQSMTGEPTKSYLYYTSGSGKGQIKSITSSQSELHYEYGDFGRLAKMTEKIVGDQSFVTQYDYDEYGNKTGITYPGGFKVKRVYNDKGFVTEIRQADNNSLIWQRLSQNAMGQPKTYKMGNNKITTYEYDGCHLPEKVFTLGIQDFEYHINPKNGNMDWRKDKLKNLREDFVYDHLNRLETANINYTPSPPMTYQPNGNIQYKPDAGVYNYNYTPSPAHGVDMISQASNELISSGNQQVDYTAFHKAAIIYNNSSQRLTIDYSVDQQRMRTRFYNGHIFLQKTKYFATNYEKEVTSEKTREINYISTPYGTLAAYIIENARGHMYYLYKDHIGSITTITNSTGTVVERRSFDAWGRLRNPDNWSYNNIPPMTILDRGYTGHEHLTEFGLINMNGRMYDPLIGRFLSPDPYVQDIAGTQGFNRYSYALNNPLKYTDPSGESFILAGAFIGAAISFATVCVSDMRNGTTTSGWEMLGHMVVGAISGALGAGIGAGAVGVIEGAVYGAAAGAATGFVGGAGDAWVRGASSSEIFRQGWMGAAWGGALGAVSGGISGGIRSVRNGGKLLTGEGAIFEQTGPKPSSNKVTIDERMEYSNEYVKGFSDKNFVENISGLDNLYSNGSIPPKSNYTIDGDLVLNKEGNNVLGLTHYKGLFKGCDVYVYKSAFTSPKQLYLTLGHEYIHVAHRSVLLANRNYSEYAAYSWEVRQAKSFGMLSPTHINIPYLNKEYYRLFYDYRFFQINDIYPSTVLP